MLSRPVIKFTLIRALVKHWLTLPGSSCLERSRLFPFSCGTFSKSSFCYEQAVGQIHQSQSQCIKVHHTVIRARTPSMEKNSRISLFVTELYLRNIGSPIIMCLRLVARLVFGCHTSTIHLPSLLLNASILPCGTRNLTISALCWHLSVRFMTSQYRQGVSPYLVHCQR